MLVLSPTRSDDGCMSLVIAPTQVHAKAVLRDVEGAVPDEAPMMIWDDEIDLGWSADEVAALREMGGFEARGVGGWEGRATMAP